jgi:hypothetical protein
MKYNGGDKGSKKPAPKTQSKSTLSSQANMIKGVASKLLIGGKKK